MKKDWGSRGWGSSSVAGKSGTWGMVCTRVLSRAGPGMGRVTTGDVMGVIWTVDRVGEDITIEGSDGGTELIDVAGTDEEVGEPPAVV